MIDRRRLETKTFLKIENLLKSEISILKSLDHPSLIKLFEALEDENTKKIYLVMEYCSKGSLMSADFWKAQKELSNRLLDDDLADLQPASRRLKLNQARDYLHQIVEGLHYRSPD